MKKKRERQQNLLFYGSSSISPPLVNFFSFVFFLFSPQTKLKRNLYVHGPLVHENSHVKGKRKRRLGGAELEITVEEKESLFSVKTNNIGNKTSGENKFQETPVA